MRAAAGDHRDIRQLGDAFGQIASAGATFSSEGVGPDGGPVSRVTYGPGPYSWGAFIDYRWRGAEVEAGRYFRVGFWARASQQISAFVDLATGSAGDRTLLNKGPLGTEWVYLQSGWVQRGFSTNANHFCRLTSDGTDRIPGVWFECTPPLIEISLSLSLSL